MIHNGFIYRLLPIVFCITAHVVTAQEFKISKVEVDGGKVNVWYDLTATNQAFTVSLYASRDNFISPLEKVSGDLGLEVKPGGNKKIVWDALAEFGPQFDGSVSLEVRGRVYIPFVRLDALPSAIRRGRETELTWTGGTQQNILNFELMRGEEKVNSFPNVANVGHYTMVLPSHTSPGTYQFRITDSRNKDQIVFTKEFRVKRKIPLLVQGAIPLVAGAIVWLLIPDVVEPFVIPSALSPDEIE